DDVVDGHHAGVVQPRRRPRLPQRPAVPVVAFLVAQPLGQDDFLDGDVTVEDLVAGTPHRAHGAAADDGFEPVPAREKTTLHQSLAGSKNWYTGWSSANTRLQSRSGARSRIA